MKNQTLCYLSEYRFHLNILSFDFSVFDFSFVALSFTLLFFVGLCWIFVLGKKGKGKWSNCGKWVTRSMKRSCNIIECRLISNSNSRKNGKNFLCEIDRSKRGLKTVNQQDLISCRRHCVWFINQKFSIWFSLKL